MLGNRPIASAPIAGEEYTAENNTALTDDGANLGHGSMSDGPLSEELDPERALQRGMRRFAHPRPIGSRAQLSGNVLHRYGHSDNGKGLAFRLSRFVGTAQHPSPKVRRGAVQRREGIQADVPRVVRGFLRFLDSKPPHPSRLLGRVVRLPGVPEDDSPRIVRGIQRHLDQQPPYPSVLVGRVGRRGGSAASNVPRVVRGFTRLLTSTPPHPQWLLGRSLRRGGVAADAATTSVPRIVRGFTRFLRHLPQHPSALVGHVLRRAGVSADIIPDYQLLPRVLSRFLTSKPVPSSLLGGRYLRRGGVAEDYVVVVPFRYVPARRLHAKPFAPSLRSTWSPFRNRHPRQRTEGHSPVWTEYQQTYQDGFRVADTSLDLFELYVGVNAPPDFTLPPSDVSPTLPMSYPSPAGPCTLHIVVRKRNRYDLQSFNVYEEIRVIDAVGAEELGPVSAPRDPTVNDAATGFVRVVATYLSTEDRNPATAWEVYVRVGSDPVIGVDAPVYEGDMVFAGVGAGLAVDVGTFAPGAVLHVLVVSLREGSGDNERGLASIVLWTMAVSLDLTDGQMFGGNVFEQR